MTNSTQADVFSINDVDTTYVPIGAPVVIIVALCCFIALHHSDWKTRGAALK